MAVCPTVRRAVEAMKPADTKFAELLSQQAQFLPLMLTLSYSKSCRVSIDPPLEELAVRWLAGLEVRIFG